MWFNRGAEARSIKRAVVTVWGKALSWDIPVWVTGMKERCFERIVIVFFDNMTAKMTTIFNSYGSFLIPLNLTWVPRVAGLI
jgi:hypothetical protein